MLERNPGAMGHKSTSRDCIISVLKSLFRVRNFKFVVFVSLILMPLKTLSRCLFVVDSQSQHKNLLTTRCSGKPCLPVIFSTRVSASNYWEAYVIITQILQSLEISADACS